MKSILAALTFSIVTIASVSSASAQYGTVGTGGSMATIHGVPHAHQHYLNSCHGLGYSGPCGLGGHVRGGGMIGGHRYGSSYRYGGGYRYGGTIAVGGPVLVRRTLVRSYAIRNEGAAVQSVVRQAPAPAPVVVQKQVVERRAVVRHGAVRRAVAAKPACDTCAKKGGSVTVGNITATATAPNATATNVVSINNVTLTGPANSTGAAGASVTKSTVVGWANHGKNAQCEGKPKFTAFQCTSPATGKQTTCMCD